MTAFTTQLVHCELFQEFQSTSFMKSQSRYLAQTVFCISEQGITEIIDRYIMNEVGATSIFGVCEITFFHQTSEIGRVPSC